MPDVILSPLGPLELRPERDADAAFRFALFCESQAPAWDLLQIDPAMRDRLMRHQFEAQIAGYRAAFPAAQFSIITLDGRPVGRIVVDRPGTFLRIVDQAISRDLRGRGIGSAVMRTLTDEAARAGVAVRLSVMSGNAAALRLYLRLGFKPVAEIPASIELEWNAPA